MDAVKRDILSLYRMTSQFRGRGCDAHRPGVLHAPRAARQARQEVQARLARRQRAREGLRRRVLLVSRRVHNLHVPQRDGPVGRPRRDGGRVVLQVLHGATPACSSRTSSPTTGRRRTRCTATSSSGSSRSTRGCSPRTPSPSSLVCSGRGLYFYSRRDDRDWSNTMEVDFLVTRGYDDAAGRMRVSPVEVKSTKRYGARSLDKFKDKFRQPRRDEVHPAPAAHGGLRRPGEAAALRLHGAVGRVWHRLPRRQPVEGRGPGRRPGAPASIPDSGVKKARLADRHKRARAPRPHNLGSDARKNKVIRYLVFPNPEPRLPPAGVCSHRGPGSDTPERHSARPSSSRINQI